MFKIDSWPPAPGNVHLDKETIDMLRELAATAGSRSYSADVRESALFQIDSIAETVGRFIARNSVNEITVQYDTGSSIANELPEAFPLRHTFENMAHFAIQREGDNT